MATCESASNASKLGFVLTLASFVFQIVGFSTPFWVYESVNDVKGYSGLWQACLSLNGDVSCRRLCEGFKGGCPNTMVAVEGLQSTAVVLMFAAVVFVVLRMSVFKSQKSIKVAGCFCCFIGGILGFVGAVLYTTIDYVKATDLHFSFAFSLIAAIGSVTAGILVYIGKMSSYESLN